MMKLNATLLPIRQADGPPCAHGVKGESRRKHSCSAPRALLESSYLLSGATGPVLLVQVPGDPLVVIPAARRYAERAGLLFTSVTPLVAGAFHAGLIARRGTDLHEELHKLRAAYRRSVTVASTGAAPN